MMTLFRRTLLFTVLAAVSFGQARLSIENIKFREYEDGAIIHTKPLYLAGSTIYLDFQVSGFLVVEKALIRSMDIGWKYQVLDPENRLVIAPVQGESATEVQNEDKDWMPKVRLEISLPPSAVSGMYKIAIDLEDRKAKTTAKGTIEFQVNSRSMPKTDGLSIVNFAFLRSEDAVDPVTTAAFQPGDPIFFKFDVVGFQLGAKNAAKVTFDLVVKDEKARNVIDARNAFELGADENFYPPRFFANQMRIDLDAKNPKGPYVLTLVAKDTVSGKTASFDYPFTLE
jgi:hypothetical protein